MSDWFLLGCIVLSLAAGAVAWWRPQAGAILLVLALPAYQIRGSIFHLPTTLLEGILLFVVAGAVLHWWSGKSPWPRIPSTWLVFAGLWLGVGVVGVLAAPDHWQALGLWRAYFLEPLLTIPLWWSLVASEIWRFRLLNLIAGQLLIIGGIAVLQRFGWVWSPGPWVEESPMRVTSWFAYPNAAALYVAPLAAYLFAAAIRLRERISVVHSSLWITAALFGFFTCFLVYSRGALLALGVGIVLTSFWAVHRKRWWVVIALVIVVGLLLPTTRQVVTKVLTKQDTSTDVRSVLWQGTWRLVRAEPITGAGLGGFPVAYQKYKLPQHIEFLQYPHNALLNVWTELGILGVIVSSIGIFGLAAAIFRGIRSRAPWAVPALIAWSVLLIHGVLDVPYFKNDLAVMAVLLAVLAVCGSTGENKNVVRH